MKLCVWLLTSGVCGEVHEAITKPVVGQACDRCLRHWRYTPCTAVMDKPAYWVWADGEIGYFSVLVVDYPEYSFEEVGFFADEEDPYTLYIVN